jgi:predicted nucleic acid-binding protein
MNYLIDTNVISEMIKSKPDKNVMNWFEAVPDESLYLSVLTLGEIRKGIGKVEDVAKKEKLRIWLEHELPAWFDQRMLDIDSHVSDRWGRLLAQHKKSLPAIDSLIAATALHFDLCLVTRNTSDFDYISDLQIINPWGVTV